jgi:transposase
VDQEWLLPPSVHDFVPAGHAARLIRDRVRETLDLPAIMEAYPEERGRPPYHPAMMTALLLYAYSRGIYAARRIAVACEERVDVMAVTGLQRPDARTISDFRKRHLAALGALFVQVLTLCREAGLVKLGYVALDGSRIKANASKHKAMSYGRRVQAEAALAAEPAPPPRRGRPPKSPPGTPADKAQRNFTDPDSRILKTKDGFIQGYNAQAALDGAQPIIVAHGLSNGNDQDQLSPLLGAIQSHTGRPPKEISAAAGSCSEANLEVLEGRGIRGYVATGRQRHGQAAATGRGRQQGPRVRAMRQRLGRGGFRSRDRFRKQIVEPVFGQIKQARGFRQFLRWPDRGAARMGAGLHRPQPRQADPGPGLRPAPPTTSPS